MAGISKLILTTSGTRRVRELPRGNVSLRIGNTPRCELRVEEGPEGPVEVYLNSCDGIWTLERLDNAYIARDGVRCALPRKLKLRDELEVRLSDTEQIAFRIELTLDLENAAPRYDRIIDIRDVDRLVVGGIEAANLYIKDGMLGQDHFTLFQRGGSLMLADNDSRWGVFVNGVHIDGECPVKNTDFISLMGYSFYYKNGCLYTDSRDNISLKGLHSVLSGVRSIVSEYPKFVRNVRKKVVLSKEEITVLDPPQKQQKPKNNIFLQLLPSIGSVLLVVLMRGTMGGGGSYVVFSACSMGLGVLTTIISFVVGNKDYKKETAAREKEYREYIQRKQTEIETAREQEAAQLAQIYCDPQLELQRIWDFSGDLFDRQKGDEDFLQIFLGKGEKPAVRPVKITQKESITVDDELFKMPRQLLDRYRCILDAPVYLHTKDDNAIGVVGDRERLREMMKLMSLDLASRHYYTDLKLVYLIGPTGMDQFPWIRWLPHVKNDALGVRSIVCDEESKNAMFEFLYVELSAREQQKRSWPRYVVFVLDDYGLKRHPISKYIGRAKDLGFTFIFMESREELLPQECDEVVTLERASDQGTVYRTDNLNEIQRFTCHPIRDREMWDAAVMMSPIYSEEVSLESSLTKNLTFYEMLGITAPSDIDLKQNWGSASVERSLAAPLGVKSKDEIVYLDLHEKAHGPHGLVAGTTGSGKSELLQSYILSMAVRYHPYEVGFVIIDFKGGGMANQLKDLPHLVGAITNIDGKEIERSLKSIKAELQKRQRLFAEANVNKIDDYIKLYKRQQVETPLPHLIIVVDEFAELRAQQPEFMKELISAARIGRSLGVHLILATQKPSGQVDDQIWSNSRFKLCLKVATSQDSNEMIKSPLAAEIREPGRAYLMIGENESLDLFQSAYSGGLAESMDGASKEFVISSISDSGKRIPVYVQKKRQVADERTATQLDAVVGHISTYCKNAGIERLPSVCLPALADHLTVPRELPGYSMEKLTLGIYDDPDSQYQGYAHCNVCNNTLIIGSSLTGKTNLLQVILRLMAERYSPRDVVFYIADFGSMYLKNFELLCHVGGVVTASEDEKFKNLIKLLVEEVARRKARFLSCGLSSYASYREAGYVDFPQIIVLIDNFSVFQEIYADKYEDQFIFLAREGVTYGISLIVTGSITSSIGYRYMSNFANRFAFTCNDTGEYMNVFDRCRMQPKDVPGRMLGKIEKELYEIQTFIAFEGEKEIERSNAIRQFVERINQKYPGDSAKMIPSIPDALTFEYIDKNYDVPVHGYKYPIGLNYADVDVAYLDMKTTNELCVVGCVQERNYQAADCLLTAIHRYILGKPVKLYMVDSLERPFYARSSLPYVEKYTVDYSEIESIFDAIMPQLEERYSLLVEGGYENLGQQKQIIIFINNRDAIEYISETEELFEAYEKMTKQFKSLGVSFIFADIEDAPVGYSAPDLLKRLRDMGRAIVSSRLQDFKFCDLPSGAVRQFKAVGKDDFFVLNGDEIARIKLPKEE